MKRNYREMLDKIEDEVEEKFYDELIHYREECFAALDILEEDYWNYNEGDLNDFDELARKVPSDVSVANANVVHDFIIIFAKFYKEVKNNIPRKLTESSLDNFLDLNLSDILTVTNELVFFSEITGALEKELTGEKNFFFHDVPYELRKSWVFEKQIKNIMDKGLVLTGDELDEEIENCFDFLDYCSVMHGVSKKNIAKIRPHFEYLNVLSSNQIVEFNILQNQGKFNFQSDERLFFIIYFSTIFELIYKMRQNESYELMTYLYALVFDLNDPLVKSNDKEEVIKKRIRRAFGPEPMTKSSTVKKIKKLAKMRVKSLLSLKKNQ